jgi:hypothetical protein
MVYMSARQEKEVSGKDLTSRDMLFVSHANPEDNDFTLWLALQLAKDGYGVWCDLTKLLGGENFWKDAEEAIRTKTARFLYVLTRRSNGKEGPRNELQIAKNVSKKDKSLHDFIVPLHIDDLPHGEINVLLTSINAIAFENGWAKGYAQLLEVLEREGDPEEAQLQPCRCLVMVDNAVQRRTRSKARSRHVLLELSAGYIVSAVSLAAHSGQINDRASSA